MRINEVIEMLKEIKVYIGILTKGLTVLLCSYYIINAQNYKVSWRLLAIILPNTWMNSINTMLTSVGTYILIIPISIVITSLIYTESKTLNVISGIFGMMGTIIIIIKGIKDGTLTEYMDFRVVTAYNEERYEEKLKLMRETYTMIVQSISEVPTKQTIFLKEYYEKHLPDIMEIIKQMQSKNIKDYAIMLVEEGMKEYKEQLEEIVKQTFYEKHKRLILGITGTLAATITVIVIYKIGKYIIGTDDVQQQHIEVTASVIVAGQDVNKTLGNVTKATVEQNEAVKTHVKVVEDVIVNGLSNEMKALHTTYTDITNEQTKGIALVMTEVKAHKTRLEQLEGRFKAMEKAMEQVKEKVGIEYFIS